MFIKTAFLQLYSKFTGEHTCGSVIQIKLVSNFTELTFLYGRFAVYFLHICRTFFEENLWETAPEFAML